MNNWLMFLIQYLPTVLHGVIAVQGAITAPGATKKQILINAISAGAQTAEQISVAHIDKVGALIDAVVTDLKNSGIHGFSNNPSPAPATTPVPASVPTTAPAAQ